ncbi:hypothetical protein Ddye_016633 [Dipteronia dyeriana]|uniref:RNase H type-1 domain-containing protein n=1 Tax=Dipteronia dyeriana TaxID=168575 RepID=A0AAD9U812_9ROSI|nr:hypothetical protein Ddye_016633 [Dipteronia dyeriana]
MVVSPALSIRSTESVDWEAPMWGVYKLNADAAVNATGGSIGIDTIIRDSEGFVLAVTAHPIRSSFPPQVAEALAILGGIVLAKDSSFWPLHVE